MAPSDLQRFKALVDKVLAEGSSQKRESISRRVNELYSKLQAGKIDEPVQARLLNAVEALSSNDCTGASKQVASISAQHWDQHKEWIIGLKQLISCAKA